MTSLYNLRIDRGIVDGQPVYGHGQETEDISKRRSRRILDDFAGGEKIQVYLFEQQADGEAAEPMEYTFADKVPVGIWDGKCEVDFADL